MKPKDFQTNTPISWCPGCSNFGILSAVKEGLLELVSDKKIKKKDIVAVTGIGCHGKMYDYLETNGFYGLHGRVIPTAWGIKLGNPELTVIGFGGDGDTFAEGISHFVHACHTNPDITMVVHNNQVFALTTGQMTPTTEKGFRGPSTPQGKKTRALNPLTLALVSGASFVSRSFALDKDHLKRIFKQAITHKGFSLIEVLQPCIIYHNPSSFLKENIYDLGSEKDFDSKNFEQALRKSGEWNYSLDKKADIPVGIFYQEKRKTLEENLSLKKPAYKKERKINLKKIISELN